MPDFEQRATVQVGEPAPDFALPAVHRDGVVSLSDYRGTSPVLLVLLRGLYCPFCRRHIVQMAGTRAKLQSFGVETLAIIASAAHRARLYYQFHPVTVPLAADPDLTTHQAYGLPRCEDSPETRSAVAAAYVALAAELGIPATADRTAIRSRLEDGFELLDSDREERRMHRVQFVGMFLVDRDGIIRWVNVEGNAQPMEGIGVIPSDEQILTAARTVLA